ncbi:hypothetical protein [Actinoplanes sp. NPDC020271]
MRRLVPRVIDGFEERFGFPPGEHEVADGIAGEEWDGAAADDVPGAAD